MKNSNETDSDWPFEQELEQLLRQRVEATKSGVLSTRTVDDIFNDVLEECTDIVQNKENSGSTYGST